MRKRFLIFFLAFVFTNVLTGCDDSTGPVRAGDLPLPTEVEQDGLRFGLYSFAIKDDWVLGLWVQNLTDTTVERTFPGDCMVGNFAAFREGQFDEPVWKRWEAPGGGGCATNSQKIQVPSGQMDFPGGWRAKLPMQRILGDSLENSSYRLAAFTVQVRPPFSELGDPVNVEMIAPSPMRLER